MNDALNFYKGKKVLVTGATGFKGSWLSIWLLQLGAEVVGYSLPPKTERDNYVVCELDKKIKHYYNDIANYHQLLYIFQKEHPDVIFHLAAQPLVLEAYDHPRYTFEINVLGTINVLDAIRCLSPVPTTILITSDKCYLNLSGDSCREEDPLGGKDPYSASKACAEIAIQSYIHSYFKDTSPVASARAGNTLGGGDWSENRLVPDCIRFLIANRPVTVRYSTSVRPWIYVLEVLYGYLKLGSFLYNKKCQNGAYNFGPGGGDWVTVKDLAKKIIKEWGCGSFQETDSCEAPYESPYLCLDHSKACRTLQWNPILDIDQTVKFVVSDYKSVNDVHNARVKRIEEYMGLRRK